MQAATRNTCRSLLLASTDSGVVPSTDVKRGTLDLLLNGRAGLDEMPITVIDHDLHVP